MSDAADDASAQLSCNPASADGKSKKADDMELDVVESALPASSTVRLKHSWVGRPAPGLASFICVVSEVARHALYKADLDFGALTYTQSRSSTDRSFSIAQIFYLSRRHTDPQTVRCISHS